MLPRGRLYSWCSTLTLTLTPHLGNVSPFCQHNSQVFGNLRLRSVAAVVPQGMFGVSGLHRSQDFRRALRRLARNGHNPIGTRRFHFSYSSYERNLRVSA